MNQLSKISPEDLHEPTPNPDPFLSHFSQLPNQLDPPSPPHLTFSQPPTLNPQDYFCLINFTLEPPSSPEDDSQLPPAPVIRAKQIQIPQQLFGFKLEESEVEEEIESDKKLFLNGNQQTLDSIPHFDIQSSDFQQQYAGKQKERKRRGSFFDECEGQQRWKRWGEGAARGALAKKRNKNRQKRSKKVKRE